MGQSVARKAAIFLSALTHQTADFGMLLAKLWMTILTSGTFQASMPIDRTQELHKHFTYGVRQ
jgi:hypothetical protein